MQTHPLVTTDWLHDHLNDADLRVIDVRGRALPAGEPLPHYFSHREDYLKGHIPGAVFVDWLRDITDPDTPEQPQVAPPERYAAVMRHSGVSTDTLVVAYDDAFGVFAARLWWALKYYGHERVAVLDGGWHKWTAEGRPVDAQLPDVPPGDFLPRPQARWLHTADAVARLLHTDTPLIDVRPPEEFNGEVSRASRAGHIPSAVNLPLDKLLNDEGRLRSAEELRSIFFEVGLDGNAEDAVLYCNAGIASSLALLALRVAGLDVGRNYDGSWQEWGNDPSRPMASGQADSPVI